MSIRCNAPFQIRPIVEGSCNADECIVVDVMGKNVEGYL